MVFRVSIMGIFASCLIKTLYNMKQLTLSVRLPQTVNGNFRIETSDLSVVPVSSYSFESFCVNLAILMVEQIASSKSCWLGEYMDLDVKIFGWELVKSQYVVKSNNSRNLRAGSSILVSDSRLRFYHIEDDVFYTAISNCPLSPYWLRRLAIASSKELGSILFNLMSYTFNWCIKNRISFIQFKLTKGSELDNI
mgnify:CR=1 FL=1